MQWLNRNNKWVKSEENLPDTKKKQKKKKDWNAHHKLR